MSVVDISGRLAGRLVGLSTSPFYRPLKADTPDHPDQRFQGWLGHYACCYARWGHRWACIDAGNNGGIVDHKEIQLLWAEKGLRVVVKRGRKRVGISTIPSVVSQKAGDV